MKDAEKLIAWLREAADELEKAHAVLDSLGVPRSVPGSDAECTLAARIALLEETQEAADEIVAALNEWMADTGADDQRLELALARYEAIRREK